MAGEILFAREGGLGIVTLNRPKALNAMTLAMYRELDPQLAIWAKDDSLHAVLIRGAGERAFCAGGDVRALYQARATPSEPGDYKFDLYREEYLCIRRVHRFPKPYVALAHGITMGGGMGLSVNGWYRVATDGTEFAMPEVFIGSTPDVGATRFLNRCPGRVGMYLALTGTRIGTADAIELGLATHYVPRDRFRALTDALADLAFTRSQQRAQVDAVVARFAENPGAGRLGGVRAAIDRCFAKNSVEQIMEALRAEPGEWATDALAAMERASPLSLELTFRQMQLGAGAEIEEALALEFRIIQNLLPRGDFFEGVRALLVDKDRRPRWRFSSVRDISDEEVERYFASLGERELRFDDQAC